MEKNIKYASGYKIDFEDFVKYTEQSVESLDNDPVYPVLKEYMERHNFTLEEKLFGVVLYTTLYNTFWTVYLLDKHRGNYSFETIGKDETVVNRTFKYGSDRRGLSWKNQEELYTQLHNWWKDRPMVDYFVSVLLSGPNPSYWKELNFETLWELSLDIPNNGSWAAFKLCDLLLNVVELNFEFTDFRVKGRAYGGKNFAWDYLNDTTGSKVGKDPKETKEVVEKIDIFNENTTKELQKRLGEKYTMDKVETTMCNFHATCKGVYYCGMDIDEMYHQITANTSQKYKKVADELLDIRESVFEEQYLYEKTGKWNGTKGILNL